jgi:2-polyprenyl-3-methyl-5-hydroxy-6-metoxy-1,4-benzoquinol methylase
MTAVLDHYEKHLGPIYLWMVGGFEAALARGAAELDALHAAKRLGGTAVDLGAGIGAHALEMAKRGYSVTAIDTCQALLDGLELRAGALPVHAVKADLLAFRSIVPGPIDVLLCMGDTLTHLSDRSAVDELLTSAAAALSEDGVFLATFRDYVSVPLHGADRFILVRAEEEQVLTCFLEYSQATVTVYDVLHRREAGHWHLRVSSYPKLRLAPEWVVEQLQSHGLIVHRDSAPGGMVRIVARRR